jgi:hypothetical protein
MVLILRRKLRKSNGTWPVATCVLDLRSTSVQRG